MHFTWALFAPLLVLTSATLLLLSACSMDEPSAPEKNNRMSESKSSKEMDLLVLAPPQLTLKEAAKKYAKGKKKNATDQENSVRLTTAAIKASDMGDNDAAETLLNEAIRLDDKNGEAYFQRGRARCNSVTGKDNAAIEDLKTAIRLGRGGARAHITLARLYDGNSQPQKAIEELNAAEKITPKEKDVYKSRAAIYMELGQREKALQDYEILARLNPNSTLPFFRKAQIFESLKRFDEARAEYTKITKVDESDGGGRVPIKPLAYKRLGVLNSERGKHDLAIADFTEALRLDNTDDEPLRLRGLEYAKLKDYKKALEDLDSSIEMSPEARENFEARAKLYDELGKTKLAEKDIAEAKRLLSKPAERPIYELKRPEETDQLK